MSRAHNAYRTGFAIKLDDGTVMMWVDGRGSVYTDVPRYGRERGNVWDHMQTFCATLDRDQDGKRFLNSSERHNGQPNKKRKEMPALTPNQDRALRLVWRKTTSDKECSRFDGYARIHDPDKWENRPENADAYFYVRDSYYRLDDGTDVYLPETWEQAKRTFESLVKRGLLEQDKNAERCFKLTARGRMYVERLERRLAEAREKSRTP